MTHASMTKAIDKLSDTSPLAIRVHRLVSGQCEEANETLNQV